jgi:hypothetical protein
MLFFPDLLPKNRYPARQYFFDVLNTIHPDYLKQVVDHASKQRMSMDGVDLKNDAIEITDEWME